MDILQLQIFQNMNYARSIVWIYYNSRFFKIWITLEILYGYIAIPHFQNLINARNNVLSFKFLRHVYIGWRMSSYQQMNFLFPESALS
jgi:hypothetical protein